MAVYLDADEVHDAYKEACDDADVWRISYPEYERLADNGLMDGLDENLPEVNDGSLAAALFKLAKRVIKKKLGGRAVALDTDDAWVTEFANLQWENNISKNAKSMASPRRKWKDAARKAAIYGSQPIITLFLERGNYTGADFIVPYNQDVKLEAGKCSDADSDIIFWDVYYTKLQVKNMLEEAEEEMKQAKADKDEWKARKLEHEAAMLLDPMMEQFDEEEPVSYNKWDIKALKEIIDANPQVERPGNEEASERQKKGIKKTGIHFYVAFQRGVNAPFYMCHSDSKYKGKPIREWSNEDPTGDTPVHYLYCYQDFINPYGIGIVKLAGGTQNVLDYMRQADILATQLGLRPPKKVKGDPDQVDFDSLVYQQDANWEVGQADVERMEMSNGVYTQLPGRITMYQTSLQKMIPMGDTSASAQESGDPTQSKTPAGVKLQAANLSIDDEDFSENVDETYADVVKSMINIHFANMQGEDLMKVTDKERQLLISAGVEFPTDENGNMSNELEYSWDEVRAAFDFEIDPDADKTKDEEKQLEGLLKVAEFRNVNPQEFDMSLAQDGKKLNVGELYSEITSLTSDNKNLIEDISTEDQQNMEAEQMMQQGVDPKTGQPMEQQPEVPGENEMIEGAQPAGEEQPEMSPEQAQANIQAVMEQYNIDSNTAIAMLEGERQGFTPEELIEALQRRQQPQEPVNV